ncbi:MAG: transcriptional repressor [Chloroflexi bacterium]|nr:transcriptional repressor [Chloroflexota bacterium]
MYDLQTILDTLRQRQFRITPQREMIIAALLQGEPHEHLTAEAVFTIVQGQASGVNLATVYRTLNFLVEQGLIQRADLGEGGVVYSSLHHGPHIHLVCRQCGQVAEMEASPLDGLAQQCQQTQGFVVDLHHVSLPGLCAACAT